jgi:hypothetical protein
MMNEDFANFRSGADPVSPLVQAPPPGASDDLRPVALALDTASPGALLTVLTTVSRLGCRITSVHACEQRTALGVLAPRRVAHRLVPCLEQLIDVLSVAQVPDEPPTPVSRPGKEA